MSFLNRYSSHPVQVVLLVHSLSILISSAVSTETRKEASFPAIFVFGDSTVDPGNNNYIGTPFTSDFPPYGIDFENHIPTGRFTNGRLVTDFIASYVGIKEYVPPYLDPTLSMEELLTGVSFASAGSGFDTLTASLTDLVDLGARKILTAGLPPIECLPIVITLNSLHSDAFHKRNCIDSLSSVAPDYNQLMGQTLKDMHNSSDLHILYVDIHNSLLNILRNTKKLGFEDANSGCCGTGLLETSFLCNPDSPVCSDASSYVFFDSVHPTERAYYIVFKDIIPTIDLLINS
ncbi:GDSL esterase/lipase At5g45960-like isoform X2 [Apium graveolens]|uniref:GDSL esterase/lipase At5g45960-like isoform X2 n=1 Tax=Apium graveolens TaxID=4045 RepID=UPI003D7BAAE1